VFGAKPFRYLVLALSLGVAVPAHAQIYSWRDANGTLVLSKAAIAALEERFK